VHDGVDQQALRVDKNVPLLALDLLSRVITRQINRGPTFSALFTLWLSITAAVAPNVFRLATSDASLSSLRLSAGSVPDSKTGAKTVHLGDAAVSLLKALPGVTGNPYVIAGKKEKAHLTDPFSIRGNASARRQASLTYASTIFAIRSRPLDCSSAKG
jgi:hypothetical protein